MYTSGVEQMPFVSSIKLKQVINFRICYLLDANLCILAHMYLKLDKAMAHLQKSVIASTAPGALVTLSIWL